MQAISALQAGIASAPGGTARVYVRGTSQAAQWYADAEASGSPSTSPIALDSGGRADVYVNSYVDVVVLDISGNQVASFTEMTSASNVEVISPAFTGTRYSDASSGLSRPVDANTVFGRWQDSAGAGAKDWKVVLGGVQTTLKAAFGPTTEMWFNVKDAAYGATGDGTTNDTTAISAAIAAAVAAGGGIVYFPPGTYRVTTALTGTSVSFIGAGPGTTRIVKDSASGNFINFALGSQSSLVEGIYFSAASTTPARIIAVSNGDVRIRNCYFYAEDCGEAIYATGTSARCVVSDCDFVPGATSNAVTWSGVTTGLLSLQRCRFTTPATYNPANGIVYGHRVDVRDAVFDCGLTTSGTVSCYTASSTTLSGSVVGCRFQSPSSGAGAITGITLGTYVDGSVFTESDNIMPGWTDTRFTAYSYTPGVAGALGEDGRVYLGTREGRFLEISHSSTGTVSLTQVQQFGKILVLNSSGGTVAYDVNNGLAPMGAMLRLFVVSGSGTLTLSLAGVFGGGASHSVTVNNTSNFTLQYSGASADVMAENTNY